MSNIQIPIRGKIPTAIFVSDTLISELADTNQNHLCTTVNAFGFSSPPTGCSFKSP